MPSDPLPLSPEPVTKAGKALVIGRAMRNGIDLMDRGAMQAMSEDVLAIEQEARTLARTEVIAEAVAEVRTLYPSTTLNWKDEVLAALSRLGERE